MKPMDLGDTRAEVSGTSSQRGRSNADAVAELHQHFTPFWVAEKLIERYFPTLDSEDLVIEPSCGPEGFLGALDPSTSAIGVEIDPRLAVAAAANTGRRIICGDFRTVRIDVQPTAIIGNPPFSTKVFDGFLSRAHELLPEGHRAGFILPTYFFQTAARVERYRQKWSISVDIMPRNAFHVRMHTPLMFAVFTKDCRRLLVGVVLCEEATALQRMAAPYRKLLAGQNGSAWLAVCKLALQRLGGRARLSALYAELSSNRPTENPWWKEKIRQILRSHPDIFIAHAPGDYALRDYSPSIDEAAGGNLLLFSAAA